MSLTALVGSLAYKLIQQNTAVPAARKAAASRAMAAMAKMIGGGFSSSGLFRTIKYTDAVEDAYKAVVWVYACVRTISDACALPGWKAYNVGKDGVLTPLPGHELEELFNNPNPYTSGADLIRDWAIDLQLAGLSYWETVFVQGKPYRLYRIRPDHLKPVPDSKHLVAEYEFQPGGTSTNIKFSPAEIVSFRYVDPLDPLGAIAPVEAARRVIQTQNSAEVWNKAIFDNMAVPGGVLEIPAEVLDTETRQNVKAELLENYTRAYVGTPMVLWGGMKWSPMSLDHTKLDFSKQSEEHKLAICAVMRVPPALVGANPDPTYSNHGTSRIALWEDLIIPHLDWLQGRINQRIAPFFSKDGKVQLRYDLSNIPAMRDSFIARVKVGVDLQALGFTRNEINARLALGFEDKPWGNAWWAPSTVTPITEESYEALLEYSQTPPAPAPAPAEPPVADDEEDTLDDDGQTADDAIDEEVVDDEGEKKKKKRERVRKPKKPALY